MTVYVLVPTGIYAAGVMGVFLSPEAATKAAAAIWPRTDGYHYFVIHKRQIGEVYPDVFMHSSPRVGPPPKGALRIVNEGEYEETA